MWEYIHFKSVLFFKIWNEMFIFFRTIMQYIHLLMQSRNYMYTSYEFFYRYLLFNNINTVLENCLSPSIPCFVLLPFWCAMRSYRPHLDCLLAMVFLSSKVNARIYVDNHRYDIFVTHKISLQMWVTRHSGQVAFG